MLTISTAFALTEKFVAFAIFLQTVEFCLIRKSLSDEGIWSWKILREEFVSFPSPIRKILSLALDYPNVLILLSLQLAATFLLFFQPHWLVLGFLFFSCVAMSMRFRGTFNGGSDYMTLLVVGALLVGRLFPVAETAALYYVAIQSCLSYFVAGIVKLAQPTWRNGRALPGFLQITNFDIPVRVQNISQFKTIMLFASWFVICFECLFPLGLLNPVACLGLLALAFSFHLANAYIFGLNRFVFAWLASYPAIYFCSGILWLSR